MKNCITVCCLDFLSSATRFFVIIWFDFLNDLFKSRTTQMLVLNLSAISWCVKLVDTAIFSILKRVALSSYRIVNFFFLALVWLDKLDKARLLRWLYLGKLSRYYLSRGASSSLCSTFFEYPDIAAHSLKSRLIFEAMVAYLSRSSWDNFLISYVNVASLRLNSSGLNKNTPLCLLMNDLIRRLASPAYISLFML